MSYRVWRFLFTKYSDNSLLAMWNLLLSNQYLSQNMWKACKSEMYQRDLLP